MSSEENCKKGTVGTALAIQALEGSLRLEVYVQPFLSKQALLEVDGRSVFSKREIMVFVLDNYLNCGDYEIVEERKKYLHILQRSSGKCVSTYKWCEGWWYDIHEKQGLYGSEYVQIGKRTFRIPLEATCHIGSGGELQNLGCL